VVIDVLDPTMKDADSVRAAFSFPVLAVIPYVKPREQSRLASLPIEQKPGPEPEPGNDERAESALPFDAHRRGRTEKAR
jgi:hypothetical protein